MPTLEWIGKEKVINHHQDVPYRVLERQYSYDEQGQHAEDNGSENMIIHGDNLEALKSLLPRYEGKIKCIYIDPPYNTGNEGWVYNDNVNDPKIRKWLGEVVGKEGEDLSRHDKWLCMMYPRLKLLYKLLDDEGVKLSNFDAQSFDLYDLILVDYALSGTTGNRIIRELRDKKIYTDIIFYSSDIETMKNELKSEEQLDGVFLIERENLFSMIEHIIQKNLKREYRISNIRGLIMDSTSEFDYICQETAIALFEKLDKDQQNSVVDKTREYVNDAATKSKRNFTDLNKKQGKKFVENALRSVEYVMDNKARYAVMEMVVKALDSNIIKKEDFSQEYYDTLIKPRNKLAHAKLVYGKCHKKLRPIKKRTELHHNEDCKTCTAEYDIKKCETLRRVIYNYYTLFKQIEKKTDELAPIA